MLEIKEVWFRNQHLSEVVVKLVQINHDSETKSGDSRNKKPTGCTCTTNSKKRSLYLDGDRNITVLAIFHLHLNTLRSSGSKYFETYFSDRWIPDCSQRQPMELTLEAQAGVAHYEDCFSTMYIWTSTKFGNVTHCVAMLKVAMQLLYEPVIEDGFCYLSTLRWSNFEVELVQELVVGSEGSFPLDSANDVVARLRTTQWSVGVTTNMRETLTTRLRNWLNWLWSKYLWMLKTTIEIEDSPLQGNCYLQRHSNNSSRGHRRTHSQSSRSTS